jgi:hypothetical protein
MGSDTARWPVADPMAVPIPAPSAIPKPTYLARRSFAVCDSSPIGVTPSFWVPCYAVITRAVPLACDPAQGGTVLVPVTCPGVCSRGRRPPGWRMAAGRPTLGVGRNSRGDSCPSSSRETPTSRSGVSCPAAGSKRGLWGGGGRPYGAMPIGVSAEPEQPASSL